jgi:sugar transferase (PEP-CTERM/EpsH1 system associated)
MKILFIVPYVPNLIRVRPFNLIRNLSAHGHQVSVFTLWSNDREREDVLSLEKYCNEVQAFHLPGWRPVWNCWKALASPEPLQYAYCWQPNLADQIERMMSQPDVYPPFDVIHLEHLRGARYGVFLKARLAAYGRSIPIVWDSVDSISHLFRQATVRSRRRASRWLTRFELKRTEQFEGWLAGHFERVIVTSPVDRDAFLKLSLARQKPINIDVLPNGVDLDYFRPDLRIERDPVTLVLSGKMSYHANISMSLYLVQEIMPLIWAQRPEVKLNIVGKDPPSEIRDLSRNPAITVTGMVPDIRPYLQKAAIAVSPLVYGTGIQNKVLEAMACATPVVSTPQAVSALNVQEGREILLAQSPPDFARQVLNLLNDPSQQREIGRAGRRYVERNHPWSLMATQLEHTYEEVVSKGSLPINILPIMNAEQV